MSTSSNPDPTKHLTTHELTTKHILNILLINDVRAYTSAICTSKTMLSFNNPKWWKELCEIKYPRKCDIQVSPADILKKQHIATLCDLITYNFPDFDTSNIEEDNPHSKVVLIDKLCQLDIIVCRNLKNGDDPHHIDIEDKLKLHDKPDWFTWQQYYKHLYLSQKLDKVEKIGDTINICKQIAKCAYEIIIKSDINNDEDPINRYITYMRDTEYNTTNIIFEQLVGLLSQHGQYYKKLINTPEFNPYMHIIMYYAPLDLIITCITNQMRIYSYSLRNRRIEDEADFFIDEYGFPTDELDMPKDEFNNNDDLDDMFERIRNHSENSIDFDVYGVHILQILKNIGIQHMESYKIEAIVKSLNINSISYISLFMKRGYDHICNVILPYMSINMSDMSKMMTKLLCDSTRLDLNARIGGIANIITFMNKHHIKLDCEEMLKVQMSNTFYMLTLVDNVPTYEELINFPSSSTGIIESIITKLQNIGKYKKFDQTRLIKSN